MIRSPASTRPLAFWSTGVALVLSTVIALSVLVGVFRVAAAVTAAPVGGVPEAVAVLDTWPAFTSAWVTGYAAAVQVVEAPGSSVVAGQLTAPTFGSVTPTAVRVTLPALVTTNE